MPIPLFIERIYYPRIAAKHACQDPLLSAVIIVGAAFPGPTKNMGHPHKSDATAEVEMHLGADPTWPPYRYTKDLVNHARQILQVARNYRQTDLHTSRATINETGSLSNYKI